MKHIICSLYISCLLLCLTFHTLMAQNQTYLPTSMYGIGELTTSDGGRYAGMGQIGIALNRQGFLNVQNPAALTRLDTIGFNFDIGLSAKHSQYAFLSNKSSGTTANPNRLSMAVRLNRRWFAMIGASPYSSTGYLIQTEEPIEGAPDSYINSLFEGEGGLYRCYLSNAFILLRGLSIGATVGMVMGTVTQSETQEGASIKYESFRRGFYTDFGLHYEFATKRKYQWSVGVIFAPSLILPHENDLIYNNTSTSEELETSYHSPTQYLPMRIGVGIGVTSERWLLTADYNYMDWKRNKSNYASVKYENQHRVNIGSIYMTNPRKPHSAELMGGIGMGNSYIVLKNRQMYYLEANIGVSLPIQHSYLSLGMSWRRQLNTRKQLMQETSWGLHLNLTFGEKLYGKRRVN